MDNDEKLKIGVSVALVLVIVGWWKLQPKPSGKSVLAPADKEAVAYNSSTHILTVSTLKGTVTEYTRNPVIHIQKDGSVKIDRKLYGWEVNPFLGVGYGGGMRAQLGLGFFYAGRFDANTQLAFSATPGKVDIVPVMSLSYNAWRNTSLYVGTNPFQKDLHIGVLTRF
jgi:hypothetical protein